MKFTGDGVNKAVKITVGLLMMFAGILFLAMPVLTSAVVLLITGIVLIIAGLVELISCMVKQCRVANRPPHIVTAIFKIALGALLLIADPVVVALLPMIFVIWLVAFGIYRIVLGMKRKKTKEEDWVGSVAIGCIALIGAVAVALVQWMNAMEMTGVFIGAIAILYGFVVFFDAFGKKKRPTGEQQLAEDKAISQNENEAFDAFRKKLHKDDGKHDG